MVVVQPLADGGYGALLTVLVVLYLLGVVPPAAGLVREVGPRVVMVLQPLADGGYGVLLTVLVVLPASASRPQ